MRYFFFLTGLLVSLTIGTILIGQQIITAKEVAIKSELEAKLLALKLSQAQTLQRIEKEKAANVIIISAKGGSATGGKNTGRQ